MRAATQSMIFAGVVLAGMGALASFIAFKTPGVQREPCPEESKPARVEPFVVVAAQELPDYTEVQLIELRATGERFLVATRNGHVSVVQVKP